MNRTKAEQDTPEEPKPFAAGQIHGLDVAPMFRKLEIS